MELDRLNVYFSHFPAGINSWTLAHVGQGIYGGRLSRFDFLDDDRNLKLYGSVSPPDYNLGKVTNKFIALIHSKDDTLANPKDFARLVDSLNVQLIYNVLVKSDNFTHQDFIWAKDVGRLVYRRVVKTLAKYAN